MRELPGASVMPGESKGAGCFVASSLGDESQRIRGAAGTRRGRRLYAEMGATAQAERLAGEHDRWWFKGGRQAKALECVCSV